MLPIGVGCREGLRRGGDQCQLAGGRFLGLLGGRRGGLLGLFGGGVSAGDTVSAVALALALALFVTGVFVGLAHSSCKDLGGAAVLEGEFSQLLRNIFQLESLLLCLLLTQYDGFDGQCSMLHSLLVVNLADLAFQTPSLSMSGELVEGLLHIRASMGERILNKAIDAILAELQCSYSLSSLAVGAFFVCKPQGRIGGVRFKHLHCVSCVVVVHKANAFLGRGSRGAHFLLIDSLDEESNSVRIPKLRFVFPSPKDSQLKLVCLDTVSCCRSW